VIKELKTYYSKISFKALLFSALALLSLSCSKTTEKIGNGLLSENDLIGVYFTDTLQIVCHSEIVPEMNTKGLGTVLFGSMIDPVMGRTDANIFTQLHLSSTSQNFGAEVVVDSIVLQLGLTGYYGDTTTLQTVHVYELDESMSIDSNYHQFDDLAVKNIDLANGYQFRPHPKTYRTILQSVIGGTTYTDTITQPIIRIPLDNSFGQYLATLDPTAYDSPDAFKDACYGLKISCESVTEDGAICYLTPTTNNLTQLQIYYRESPSSTKPMRYYFYITSEDAYFDQYLHDYTLGSPEFIQQVIDSNALLGQDQLYLQSMGGVRSVLTFPNLTKWSNTLEPHTHIVINEAKLIFPASETLDDNSDLTPPTTLALLNIVDADQTSLLQDYYEGASYYGGGYSNSNKNVTFRIGEHLQRVLMGTQETQGLYVSISGAAINAQRWIIAGPNAENGLQCQIKYSIVSE
jgi:hypothetical protein